MLLSVFFILGCTGKSEIINEELESNPATDEANNPNWIILIYSVADSNLESIMVSELKKIEMIPDVKNISVYMYVDRAKTYDESLGNWSGARLYKVRQSQNPYLFESEIIEEYGDVDSSSQVQMKHVFETVFSHKAKYRSLIINAHGGGWRGIGGDLSANESYMNITSLSEVLSQSPKVNVLYFYSCLMGQLEVLDQIYPYADYIVFSEDVMYGFLDSYYFKSLFSQVFSNIKPRDLAILFAKEYGKMMNTHQSLKVQKTISVIDVSVYKQERSKIDTLLTSITSNLSLLATQQLFDSTHTFFEGYDYVDLLDLARVISLISPSDVNASQSLSDSLQNVIIYNDVGLHNNLARGLSVYTPLSVYDVSDEYYALNSSWSNKVNRYVMAAREDKSPPIIINNNIVRDRMIIDLNVTLRDELLVNTYVISGYFNQTSNQIISIQLEKARFENDSQILEKKLGLQHMSLINGAKKYAIIGADQEYDLIRVDAQVMHADNSIYPIIIYFDKNSGYFYEALQLHKNSLVSISLVKGDTLLLSKFDLKGITIDESFYDTMSIQSQGLLRLSQESIPANADVKIVFKDMNNNKKLILI